MHVAGWKIVVGVLMVVTGIALAGQVVLFDDTPAALRVHRDLPPDADPGFVDLKVAAWALAGLGWIVAGVGLATGRREWLPAAFLSFLLVDGLYAAQFWLWGGAYPAVWAGFAVFGLLALAWAAVCRRVWFATDVLR